MKDTQNVHHRVDYSALEKKFRCTHHVHKARGHYAPWSRGDAKRQILEPIYARTLELSDPWRQKVGWWRPRAGWWAAWGISVQWGHFQCGKMQNLGNGWRQCLHDKVSVHVTELYAQKWSAQ